MAFIVKSSIGRVMYKPTVLKNLIRLALPVATTVFLVFLAIFLCSSLALGIAPEREEPEAEPRSQNTPQLYVGGGLSSFSYTEYSRKGSFFMSEKGVLPLLSLSTSLPMIEGSYLLAEGKVHWGGLTYQGATQNGVPLEDLPTRDALLSGDLFVVYPYSDGGVSIEPYGGWRSRYWFDEIIHDDYGYRREVTQSFVTGGMNIYVKPTPNFSVGLGGDFSALSYGRVKSHLSDADKYFNDPVVKQTEGIGYRLQLSASSSLPQAEISARAHIQIWDVPQSEKDLLTYKNEPYASVVEPQNFTKMLGLELRISF
ncbi:MAG: hypothetical protein ACOCZX_02790 [Candidatus Bipolaricaulota bacterium]